jgi:DNA-directed RNA polymerase specialized sigma24 family protein
MNKKLIDQLIGMTRTEIEHAIDERVICRQNAQRNREIFKLAYLDGISQERIAEKYGLTPRQVQNALYDTERILLKHL